MGAAKGKRPNTEALCQPPPPLLPFQCLRLTAKMLLRCFRCQEDLTLKFSGPPSVGTIGGPWEEGGAPAKPSSATPPPPPPSNTALPGGTV